MDFNALVNKLYQIEPTDVRHINMGNIQPQATVYHDDYVPNYIAESAEVPKNTLKAGVPDDLSDFLRLSGAPTKTYAQPYSQPVMESPVYVPYHEEENPQDTITVDVPLLIRLLEYAREDAKTDMDLHKVSERLIKMSQSGKVLTMDDYNLIIQKQEKAPKAAPKRPVQKSSEFDIESYLREAYKKFK